MLATAGLLLPGPTVAEEAKGEPGWLKHINAQLEKNISLNFVDVPLADAVAFLANITGTPIILDPKAATGEEPITLKVNDMKLGPALRRIAQHVKLECSIENGAIFISTKKRIVEGGFKVPKVVPEKVKAAFARKVSFDFVDTPLDDVSHFIGKVAGIDILIHPDVQPKKVKIALKVNGMTIEDVLGWLMRMYELTYESIEHGAILISAEKRIIEGGAKALKPVPKEVEAAFAKKVSFDFVDMPLNDVTEYLAKLTGMNFLVHPDVQPKKVKITLRANKITIEDALGWLMRMHDLTYKAEAENTIYIFTRKQVEKPEKR